jgi:flagellar biosynthesis/type III secretory pathway protein FliH
VSGNPTALTLTHPLDLDDARVAARKLATLRQDAEKQHEDAAAHAADMERDYRKGFARAYAEIRMDGAGAGEADVRAKGATADQGRDRDIARALERSALERLRGLEGERSMLKSLIDWSSRMRLDERQAA